MRLSFRQDVKVLSEEKDLIYESMLIATESDLPIECTNSYNVEKDFKKNEVAKLTNKNYFYSRIVNT